MHKPVQLLDKIILIQWLTQAWGHQFGQKQGQVLCLTLQNMAGIPTGEEGDIKLDTLKLFIQQHKVNIFTMTKLNTAWDLLLEPVTPSSNQRVVGNCTMEYNTQ